MVQQCDINGNNATPVQWGSDDDGAMVQLHAFAMEMATTQLQNGDTQSNRARAIVQAAAAVNHCCYCYCYYYTTAAPLFSCHCHTHPTTAGANKQQWQYGCGNGRRAGRSSGEAELRLRVVAGVYILHRLLVRSFVCSAIISRHGAMIPSG